jgi:phage head maturation protease
VTEGEQLVETETLLRPEDQVRSFDAMHLDVKPDGLVEALVVPWEVPAEVVEPHPATGAPVTYLEQFARGSLDRAMAAPGRIGLAFTHSDAFADRLGYGVDLRDSAEGAVATFQLYRSVMDKALEMLGSSHSGMSMTFRSLRPAFATPDRSGQLVTRERVHLRYVAATDCPVYQDAQVLALRDEADSLRQLAEEQQARQRRMVQALVLLQEHGRDLTERQVEFLDQHRALLDA